MLAVRNLHTFAPNGSGVPALLTVDATGVVDTDATDHWGLYSGDPAILESGDMVIWDPMGDPEDPDPYTESWVRSTGCQLWHAAGDGAWYSGKTVQVGLIYEGDDIGEVSVDIHAGMSGDGYYAVFVSYPSSAPAPQIVWLVGAVYEPEPEPEPTTFWANFRECHEV